MEAKPETKLYHVHGMNSRDFLKSYFDAESAFRDETVVFFMEKLHSALATGRIRGDTLIDISNGPFVHHLFGFCGYFKEIIVLRPQEACIMELNKWVNTRTGAFDWTHASNITLRLAGISAKEHRKEEHIKGTIKYIGKCDFRKDNPSDPEVLPPADCLLLGGVLEAVSQNHQEYITNLRKISKLLVLGGCLIILGGINMTYYTAGKDKLHALTCDESFIRKTLTDEGFVITSCELCDRKAESDLTDYKQLMVLTAVKGKI